MPGHLVVTVHGIRTFGQWQERLERLLKQAEPGIHVLNYKYGYFSAVAFSIPVLGHLFRWIETRRFRRRVLRPLDAAGWTRIDVVAHSFGTHVVAWALHGMSPAARWRIHTLVLAGSVLKTRFPWHDVIGRSVGRVVNECGIDDSVLVLNQICVLGTGMAGRVGFGGPTGDTFRNRYWNFGHSGFFERRAGNDDADAFMREQWVPVLTSEAAIPAVDDRRPLSALGGVWLFVLNNVEPLKLLTVAVVLGTPLLMYASLYRTAEEQRLVAVARYLASESERLARWDPQRSVLLGVEAVRVVPRAAFDPVATARTVVARLGLAAVPAHSPVPASEQALRNRLATATGLALEALDEPVVGVHVSADGHSVVAVGQRGMLKAWTRDEARRLSKIVDTQLGSVATAIAIAADARGALIGSSDGRVQLWRLAAGSGPTPVVTLATFSAPVTDVTFGADGRRMAAASASGDVQVWFTPFEGAAQASVRAVVPGGERGAEPGHSVGPTRVSFAQNGDLTVGAPDGSVYRWPARDIGLVAEPVVVSRDRVWTPVALVKASHDGRWIATGGGAQEGGFLFEVDATHGLKARTVVGSGVYRTTAVAFSRDDRLLATVSSADDSVAVWGLPPVSTETGAGPRQLLRAFDGGQSVALTQRWLVTGSRDHAVRVRRVSDPGDGTVKLDPPLTLWAHGDGVTAVAVSDDGGTLVSGARDGTLHAWTLSPHTTATGDGLEPWSLHGRHTGMPVGDWSFRDIGSERRPGRFAFSSDDRFIVDAGRRICQWALDEPGAATSCKELTTDRFTPTTVSANARWLVQSRDAGVRLVSVGGAAPAMDLRAPDAAGRAIRPVRTSPVDRAVAAVTDTHVVVWDLTAPHTAPTLLALGTAQRPPLFAEFSTDGRALITVAGTVVDVRDAAAPARPPFRVDLRDVGAQVTDVTISPDGRWLAGGGDDGKIAIVSLGGARPPEIRGLVGGFTPGGAVVAFSADGRWLAAGGSSETVSVWALGGAGIKEERLLHGNRGGVTSLCFSADGDRLFAATASKQIRAWQLHGIGRGEAIVLPYTGHVAHRLVASPGGAWLAAHDVDDVVHVWALDPDRLIRRARHFVGRNLTGREWQEYFPAAVYRRTFGDLAPGSR